MMADKQSLARDGTEFEAMGDEALVQQVQKICKARRLSLCSTGGM